MAKKKKEKNGKIPANATNEKSMPSSQAAAQTSSDSASPCHSQNNKQKMDKKFWRDVGSFSCVTTSR